LGEVVNPYETSARWRKVAKLTAAIDDYLTLFRSDRSGVLDAMRAWTTADWTWLANEAGVKPPSLETQRAVIELYEQRTSRSA
jgi:hypothetical protein